MVYNSMVKIMPVSLYFTNATNKKRDGTAYQRYRQKINIPVIEFRKSETMGFGKAQ